MSSTIRQTDRRAVDTQVSFGESHEAAEAMDVEIGPLEDRIATATRYSFGPQVDAATGLGIELARPQGEIDGIEEDYHRLNGHGLGKSSKEQFGIYNAKGGYCLHQRQDKEEHEKRTFDAYESLKGRLVAHLIDEGYISSANAHSVKSHINLTSQVLYYQVGDGEVLELDVTSWLHGNDNEGIPKDDELHRRWHEALESVRELLPIGGSTEVAEIDAVDGTDYRQANSFGCLTHSVAEAIPRGVDALSEQLLPKRLEELGLKGSRECIHNLEKLAIADIYRVEVLAQIRDEIKEVEANLSDLQGKIPFNEIKVLEGQLKRLEELEKNFQSSPGEDFAQFMALTYRPSNSVQREDDPVLGPQLEANELSEQTAAMLKSIDGVRPTTRGIKTLFRKKLISEELPADAHQLAQYTGAIRVADSEDRRLRQLAYARAKSIGTPHMGGVQELGRIAEAHSRGDFDTDLSPSNLVKGLSFDQQDRIAEAITRAKKESFRVTQRSNREFGRVVGGGKPPAEVIKQFRDKVYSSDKYREQKAPAAASTKKTG